MLGVFFAFLAAFCYGLAAVIQKYSMGHFKKFEIKEIIKHRVWLFSIVVGALGILFYLFALATADLTTIQPMLSLSLVIPIIAGVAFFKEKLVLRQWVAIFLVLVGIVIVSI